MPRICELCCRGYLQAMARSHSNIATKRRQLVNLQVKRIEGRVMRLCANCIKTMAKEARARTA